MDVYCLDFILTIYDKISKRFQRYVASLTRAVVFGAFPKTFDAGALIALHLTRGTGGVRLIPEVTGTLRDRHTNIRLYVQRLENGDK